MPNQHLLRDAANVHARIVRQSLRRERAEEIVEMICNTVEIPEEIGKYLAVEKHSGDHIWGIFADTLDSLASELDSSDTDRDDILVHDLDTGEELVACTRVVSFYNCDTAEKTEVKL